MNEIITDIKALHEETLNNLKSSKAINTIRAYKSDFKDFGAFCVKHNFRPLPTEPKIASLYMTYLSANGYKMSTLRHFIRVYTYKMSTLRHFKRVYTYKMTTLIHLKSFFKSE